MELPSIFLALGDIERAYSDAGFIDVFCRVVTVDTPHHANVTALDNKPDGISPVEPVAMAVVVARKPNKQDLTPTQ